LGYTSARSNRKKLQERGGATALPPSRDAAKRNHKTKRKRIKAYAHSSYGEATKRNYKFDAEEDSVEHVSSFAGSNKKKLQVPVLPSGSLLKQQKETTREIL